MSSQPLFEIIIVASGLSAKAMAQLQSTCGAYTRLPVMIVTAPQSPAGTNRNLGIDRASGNWITFLDADDLYLPTRLERLHKAALQQNASAVGHDYRTFRNPLIGHLKLLQMSTAARFRERGAPTGSTLTIEDFVSPSAEVTTNVSNLRLHHAHTLVRRDVFKELRFSDTPDRNEDGLFLRALIESGHGFFRVDEPLSLYYLGNRLLKLFTLATSRP